MMETKQWQRTINGQKFIISTSKSLLPYSFVHDAMSNPAMYWTSPPSPSTFSKMMKNSCTLGLYKLHDTTSSTPTPTNTTPIGMARMVTDYATFAFLTDVYILSEYQKLGLGKWIVGCCREIVTGIEELRWMLLFTGTEDAVRMYTREFGMQVLGTTESGLRSMGAKKAAIVEAHSKAVETMTETAAEKDTDEDGDAPRVM